MIKFINTANILEKILVSFGIIVILGFVFGFIIDKLNLQFRPWVITVFVFSICGFIVSFIICILNILKKSTKIISQVLYTLICLALIPIILLSLFITAWSHSPEHIVDNKVAVVRSFLEVYVDYYEHKNWFIMGKNKSYSEWYGSGGYDPFEINPMPTPKQ